MVRNTMKLIQGVLQNVYEAVDVLTLIRAGDYHNLELTVGEALLRRAEVVEMF